ncbi:uncharacterized protein LOC144142202 [Haemaphysalis longicornis]
MLVYQLTSSLKNSDYFSVQLPSSHCCFALALRSVNVGRALLLLLVDVDSNLGPNSFPDDSPPKDPLPANLVLSELQKLPTLLAELLGPKVLLLTTNEAMADLTKRITEVEVHYQCLLTVRKGIETIKGNTAEISRQIFDVEPPVDEAGNLSRKNNLNFYGLPDPNPSEKFADSPEIIIHRCHDHINLILDSELIERAHSVGQQRHDHQRPIIVKLTFLKTKEEIFSNKLKLKDTNYSIGEDFPESVRKTRKHFVALVCTKSEPFSLR